MYLICSCRFENLLAFQIVSNVWIIIVPLNRNVANSVTSVLQEKKPMKLTKPIFLGELCLMYCTHKSNSYMYAFLRICTDLNYYSTVHRLMKPQELHVTLLCYSVQWMCIYSIHILFYLVVYQAFVYCCCLEGKLASHQMIHVTVNTSGIQSILSAHSHVTLYYFSIIDSLDFPLIPTISIQHLHVPVYGCDSLTV